MTRHSKDQYSIKPIQTDVSMTENKGNGLRPVANQSDSKMVYFPVVGIGASAGGLEAFRNFFQAMPANSGIAFVLIQHL